MRPDAWALADKPPVAPFDCSAEKFSRVLSHSERQTMNATLIDIEAIRAEFPILHRPLPDGQPLVYLDSGATSQRPRRVLDKLMECYEQYNANAHRGIHPLGSRVTDEVEAAREKLRAFLNAESTDEIVFTSGTTASINLVAQSW